MTETEQLEAILETCNSEGWQLIMDDLQETVSGLNNIVSLSDEKALFKSQGKIEALTVILNYEEMVRNQLEELDADFE